MKRLLVLFILFFSSAVDARQLVIIHTTDLHSHLSGTGPEAEYTPLSTNDDNTLGGFSRIASFISDERKKSKYSTEYSLSLDSFRVRFVAS